MNNLISQAISAFEQGDFVQLEQYLRPILMQDPAHEIGLLLLARYHRHHQQYEQCQKALTELITHHPNNPEGFISMGNLFAHQNQQERSISWYHMAIDLAPERIDLWQNWGHALFDLKKYDEAQKKYAQALILQPQNPELIFAYATCLRELGELHSSEQHVRSLLQTYPGNAQYWALLAVLMRDKHHNELADRYYKHALQLAPDNVFYLANRGAVLVELGDMIQAKKMFDEALNIIKNHSHHTYQTSLEQSQLLNTVSQHLGYWHLHQGDYQTGFRLLESRFLTLNTPHLTWFHQLQQHSDIIDSLANIKNEISNNEIVNNSQLNSPLLKGKHILLIAEQGLGDNLQFIRYAQALMQQHQVSAITVLCDISLKRLLQKQNYITQVILWNKELQQLFNNQEQLRHWIIKNKFNYFSSILSLPYFFDAAVDNLYAPVRYLKPVYDDLNTILDHISVNVNPINIANGSKKRNNGNNESNESEENNRDNEENEENTTNNKNKTLAPILELSTIQWLKAETRPKIGIVWSAGLQSDEIPQDAKRNNQHRSIPLKHLKPLLELDHLAFVSLQKDEGHRYTELIDLQHTEPVFHQLKILKEFYPTSLSTVQLDFSTTAQIIDELDLVITVDTSIVHLSAALGKPTWLLNRKNTCWRFAKLPNNYQQSQEVHSVWYPSVRIFSQIHLNQWESVIQEVLKLLN